MVATTADIELAFQAQQTSVAQRVQNALALLWAQVDPRFVDESITALRDQIFTLISVGQVATAQNSLNYLAVLLGLAPDEEAEAEEEVQPKAFSGLAQSGFSVAGGATLAIVATKAVLKGGMPQDLAVQYGLRRIQRFAFDEVQDSGREALQVATVIEPAIVAYERVVRLPACGRCLLLAGKRYRKNTAFLRHPQDDCTMRPVTRGQNKFSTVDTNPAELFDRMNDEQLKKSLGGEAELEAYKNGADPGTLINSRRGMATPGSQYTTQGVTSRSLFASQNKAEPLVKQPGVRYRVSGAKRLSPAGCREAAGGDNAKYQELLKKNAYIVG